jgi:hypothetical protein
MHEDPVAGTTKAGWQRHFKEFLVLTHNFVICQTHNPRRC